MKKAKFIDIRPNQCDLITRYGYRIEYRSAIDGGYVYADGKHVCDALNNTGSAKSIGDNNNG